MEATFDMNNSKTYNMIVLGALLKIRNIVPVESVMAGLKKVLPERHHNLLDLNRQAIMKGMDLVNG